MKLRIKDNSIRFRLSKPEIDLLLTDAKVSSTCQFVQNTLIYTCQITADDRMSASFADNEITINIPKNWAHEWRQSDKIGFECTDELGFFILVEKDFQCLKPRLNEDESDLFTNPQAQNDVC